MSLGPVWFVVLIGAAASYFAKYIQDNKWVGYVGLAVILLIAIQLIIGGLIDYNVLTINEPLASFIPKFKETGKPKFFLFFIILIWLVLYFFISSNE